MLASGAYLLGTVDMIKPLSAVSSLQLAGILSWLIPTWLTTGIRWCVALIVIGTLVDLIVLAIWLIVVACRWWGGVKYQ